jgi:hypothetical protein
MAVMVSYVLLVLGLSVSSINAYAQQPSWPLPPGWSMCGDDCYRDPNGRPWRSCGYRCVRSLKGPPVQYSVDDSGRLTQQPVPKTTVDQSNQDLSVLPKEFERCGPKCYRGPDDLVYSACGTNCLLTERMTGSQFRSEKHTVSPDGSVRLVAYDWRELSEVKDLLKLEAPNHEAQVSIGCIARYGPTPAGAGCITTTLTFGELDKCFKVGIGGRGCFGDNNTLRVLVTENFNAARREANPAYAALRGFTGVSLTDIEKHGPLGGPNSDARKLCNFIFGHC